MNTERDFELERDYDALLFRVDEFTDELNYQIRFYSRQREIALAQEQEPYLSNPEFARYTSDSLKIEIKTLICLREKLFESVPEVKTNDLEE